jgi:hypothetical protein
VKKALVLLVVLLMATVGLLVNRWKKNKPILLKADKYSTQLFLYTDY